MSDGGLTKDKRGRFCISCNREHGFLYACPSYPEDVKKQITLDGKKFRESCSSGEIKISKNGQTKTWNEWVKDGDL